MNGDGTASLYETLARWQWLRSCWRRRNGEGFDMRKRLLASSDGAGPADGAAGLDRWLIRQLGSRSKQRVVDLGCGFGASLLRWLAAGSERCTGITTSALQVRVAVAAATRSGVAARCSFVRQDFAVPLAGRFDVAIAIESLQHAQGLPAALGAVRVALAPGGVLLWVDDVLRERADVDGDVRELAARWRSPPLRHVTAVREALRAGGFQLLRETDLTAQVARAPMPSIERRARALARLRACLPLPSVRRLGDAFLGGLALERLYARELACYRVWMAERCAEVP